MPRGRLIVIEGLDRSGKTTQCNRLVSHLNSFARPATLFKFPDRTTAIGGMIDAYLTSRTELNDSAIHLLFSANRWECMSTITNLLDSGTHIVLDRYIYSGIAFSVTKGLDKTWCRASDVGLPRPDVVLFLNVSEQVAAQRGGYGQERYERADVQRRVKGEFMCLFEGDERVRILDATKDMDAVERDVWTLVMQDLDEAKKDEPLDTIQW